MASMGVVSTSNLREPAGHNVGVDRLPEEMNDMKIRDDKVHLDSLMPLNFISNSYCLPELGLNFVLVLFYDFSRVETMA